jgi:hypothetical protein
MPKELRYQVKTHAISDMPRTEEKKKKILQFLHFFFQNKNKNKQHAIWK